MSGVVDTRNGGEKRADERERGSSGVSRLWRVDMAVCCSLLRFVPGLAVPHFGH